MILVDIGNTNLSFFYFKRARVAKTAKLATAKASKKAVEKILRKFPRQPILVCSVVPKINHLFSNLNRKVYWVGRKLKVPIVCEYNKSQVGLDRLVSAYAAKILFPKVRIVIDFGTAITLDFISKTGSYQGGIILPGVGSTLSVFSGCALLPKKITISKSKGVIPKNTAESISKGVLEGFPAMINSLVKRYQKGLKIPKSGAVVITGGEAALVKSGLKFNYHYQPYLVAKGLRILAKEPLS